LPPDQLNQTPSRLPSLPPDPIANLVRQDWIEGGLDRHNLLNTLKKKKTMRAIFINPHTRTVAEAEYQDRDHLLKLLDCEFLTFGHAFAGDELVLDNDWLENAGQKDAAFWFIKDPDDDSVHFYSGNAILIGEDSGEDSASELSLETVREAIAWAPTAHRRIFAEIAEALLNPDLDDEGDKKVDDDDDDDE
jgi:hypothetical protein